MSPMHRHVVGNEIALADEVVVVVGRGIAEIGTQDVEDQLPTVASLRTCRVVHHVLGYELVDRSHVAALDATHQFLHDLLRRTRGHGTDDDSRARDFLSWGCRANIRSIT